MSRLEQTFAERLRAARASRGLTQAELAEEAGLAVEALGRLERARSLPRADTLAAIARALSVSCDHLLGLDGGEPGLVVARDGAGLSPELHRLVREASHLPDDTVRALVGLVKAMPRPPPPRRRAR